MKQEDFSLEDNQEVQKTFANLAQSEFRRTIEKLKRDKRKSQLLYLRSLPRTDRKALRSKYGIV